MTSTPNWFDTFRYLRVMGLKFCVFTQTIQNIVQQKQHAALVTNHTVFTLAMFSYAILKHLHLSSIVLSLALFILRFFWRQQNSPMLQKRWVKILPHSVDTLLLLSAIGMAWIASINPFEQHWLAAKIIALFAYIIAGTFAIKRAQTAGRQTISFILALICFAYIVAVAINKQVLAF